MSISLENKNILHVINIYFSLAYLCDQFKYFSQKGYKQHLICSPSPQLFKYAIKQGILYEEIKISRNVDIPNDLKSLIKIMHYIRKQHISIVVGHTPKGALLAMLAAFILRVPKRIYFRHGLVYDTMHGFRRSLMKNLDRLTALCATQVVCVSPSLAQQSILDRLNPFNKQLVLGKGTCSGIDAIDKFNPELVQRQNVLALKDALGINNNSFVVGYCGRLVRDKGIIDLLEGFQILKTILPNKQLKLLLVGGFEDRDSLPLSIIDDIRNNKDIIYTGFVYESIEIYYSLMDVFILPSYREGFGIVTLEAAAMELPVLVTKITGCIDAIEEGITGYFVSNTPEGISTGLLQMINNPDLKKLGLNGRKRVLQYFESSILLPLIESKLYN